MNENYLTPWLPELVTEPPDPYFDAPALCAGALPLFDAALAEATIVLDELQTRVFDMRLR